MSDFASLTAQLQALLVENEALRERVAELERLQASRDRWASRATLLAGQQALVLPESLEEEIASLPAGAVAEKLREVWAVVLGRQASPEPAKSLTEGKKEE